MSQSAAVPYIDNQDQLVRAHGLRPESLGENRQGRLSTDQKQDLRRKGGRALLILVAAGAVMLVLGILGLISPRSFVGQSGRLSSPLTYVFLIVVGAGLLVAGVLVRRQSASAEDVASVEGFVTKSVRNNPHGRSAPGYRAAEVRDHLYEIGGQQFAVSAAAYRTLDPALRYRVYYEPKSRTIVNLEVLDTAVGSSSAPPAAGFSPPAAAPDPNNRLGAFVTAQEVSAATATQMLPTQSKSAAEVQGMVSQEFQDSGPTWVVNVGLITRSNTPGLGLMERALAKSGRQLTGIGDEASYANGMLLVRCQGATVSVMVHNHGWRPDDPRIEGVAQQIATHVVSRLASVATPP